MLVIESAILIGWVCFWVYWLAMASTSKRNVHHNGSSSAARFSYLIGLRIALAVIAVLTVDHFLKNHTTRVTSDMLVQILGLLLFVIGLGLAIWARRYLGKNWGMPMSEKEDPELVTTGPYSFIRHPIYTGILLAAFGSILSVSLYWVIVFIICAVYFVYSATVEEKIMAKTFPKTYPDYKKKTKMLIPFLF